MATTSYRVVKSSEAKVSEGQTTLNIARTDGKKGKSGNVIVVPVVSDAVVTLVHNYETGKQWIIAAIDDLRTRVASTLNKAGKEITSDALGIDALIAAMAEENASQRLSRDSIAAWFDSTMSAVISGKVQEKFAGTGIADDKVALLVGQYRETFCELGGRGGIKEKKLQQLVKVLQYLPDDHEHAMTTRISEKLTSLLEDDIELALGD